MKRISNTVGFMHPTNYNDGWSTKFPNLSFGVITPRMNWAETKDGGKVEFEVPGFCLEDLKVSVNGKVLSVSGERKFKGGCGCGSGYEEFKQEDFTRCFTLPEALIEGSISASLKNGILTIEFKKEPETASEKIRNIKITG